MTETQQQPDTDAGPTPGPYQMIETWHGNKMLDAEGQIRSICKVYDTGREADSKNVALIKAAFEAAQEAKGMGYDPVAAVEALPELLRMMENAAIDLTDLRAFVARNERHNIKTTRSARRVLQKALAKAGADETMIPGDDGEVDDALNRAEGSEHDG